MISIEQIRAARALLGLVPNAVGGSGGAFLCRLLSVSRGVTERAPPCPMMLERLFSGPWKKAGVEFIAENGGGAGVRMKRRKR